MYYTYGHYKADSKSLFYIGKGKGSRAHKKDSRSVFWKNIVAKHGYSVEIFAEWETEKEAFEHEKFLISCFKDLTDLCNFTNGGEGCSGYVWTEDQIKKIKGRIPHNAGKSWPDSVKQKLRDSQIGISRGNHSKEHSEKIAKALKGKKKSESHILKMRENAINQATMKMTCPHCGIESNGPVMKRWHFNNCRSKAWD